MPDSPTSTLSCDAASPSRLSAASAPTRNRLEPPLVIVAGPDQHNASSAGLSQPGDGLRPVRGEQLAPDEHHRLLETGDRKDSVW